MSVARKLLFVCVCVCVLCVCVCLRVCVCVRVWPDMYVFWTHVCVDCVLYTMIQYTYLCCMYDPNSLLGHGGRRPRPRPSSTDEAEDEHPRSFDERRDEPRSKSRGLCRISTERRRRTRERQWRDGHSSNEAGLAALDAGSSEVGRLARRNVSGSIHEGGPRSHGCSRTG